MNLNKLLITETIRVLESGGVICYPTETVYGLGCNAFDKKPVSKIYKIKGRVKNKPLIILVKDFKMASKIAYLGKYKEILGKYWPGPLTGVFRAKVKFPRGITKNGKVAIRISSHQFVSELFRRVRFPIISTSANTSGSGETRSIKEITASLKHSMHLLDLVIDIGVLPESLPSTVVDFTKDEPSVLRIGAVEFDA